MEFDEKYEESLLSHQFKCECFNKTKRWWAESSTSVCKRCGTRWNYLDLEDTIGIGWFGCKCGRRYAGFSRGDVTSKCHGCQRENYPVFIVKGEKAHKDDKRSSTAKHHCSMCNGNGHCPIIMSALNIHVNVDENINMKTEYRLPPIKIPTLQKPNNSAWSTKETVHYEQTVKPIWTIKETEHQKPITRQMVEEKKENSYCIIL